MFFEGSKILWKFEFFRSPDIVLGLPLTLAYVRGQEESGGKGGIWKNLKGEGGEC